MLPRTKLIIAAVLVFVAVLAFDQMRRSSSDTDSMMSTTTQEAITSADWKEFVPNSGKFKVMLPAMPQHASDAVPLPSGQGLIKYDMYLSQEKDGTTFMVSLIQYPNEFDTSNAPELLDSVMKEMMAGNSNNRLSNQQKGLFLGNPSNDFAIQNNDVFIRSKTFLLGKTLYVLTLVDRNSPDLEPLFLKFVDSFQVTDMPAMLPEQKPDVTDTK